MSSSPGSTDPVAEAEADSPETQVQSPGAAGSVEWQCRGAAGSAELQSRGAAGSVEWQCRGAAGSVEWQCRGAAGSVEWQCRGAAGCAELQSRGAAGSAELQRKRKGDVEMKAEPRDNDALLQDEELSRSEGEDQLSKMPCFREPHSRIEKRRRDKMNLLIHELSALIPSCRPQPRKLDKLTVLRRAVQHLKVLGAGASGALTERSTKPSILPQDELLHLLLRAADGFLLVVTCDGAKILFISESVSKVLNFSRLELTGQSLFDFLHHRDVPKVKEQLASADTILRQNLTDSASPAPSPPQAAASCRASCVSAGTRRSFFCRMKHSKVTGSQGGLLRPTASKKKDAYRYCTLHCTGYMGSWPSSDLDSDLDPDLNQDPRPVPCLVTVCRLHPQSSQDQVHGRLHPQSGSDLVHGELHPQSGPDQVHSGLHPQIGPGQVHSGLHPQSGPDQVHSGLHPQSGPDLVHSELHPQSGPDQVHSRLHPQSDQVHSRLHPQSDQVHSRLHLQSGPDQVHSRLHLQSGPDQVHSRLHLQGGPDQVHSRLHPQSSPDQVHSKLHPQSGPDQVHSRLQPQSGPDQVYSRLQPQSGPDQVYSRLHPRSGPDQVHSRLHPQSGPDQVHSRSPSSPSTRPLGFITRCSIDGKFTFVDQQATTVTGFLPQEIIGTSWYEYFHHDDLQHLADKHREVLRSRERIETPSYRFKTKQGSYVRLQSEWFSFTNPWTKDIDFIVSLNRVAPGSSTGEEPGHSRQLGGERKKIPKELPIIPSLSTGDGMMIYASSIGTQIANELLDAHRISSSPSSGASSPFRQDKAALVSPNASLSTSRDEAGGSSESRTTAGTSRSSSEPSDSTGADLDGEGRGLSSLSSDEAALAVIMSLLETDVAAEQNDFDDLHWPY